MDQRMSKIFEFFAGEFVRITLKNNHKQSIEHNNTIKTIESPMIVEGYLTEEEEDKYFFLGSEPGEVGVVVVQERMSTMEILDPNNLQEDLFNDFLSESEGKKGDMN